MIKSKQKIKSNRCLNLKKRIMIGVGVVMTTMISTSGIAVLEVYSNFLSQNIVPTIRSVWYWTRGYIVPIPDDKQYVFDIGFYIPSDISRSTISEHIGISIPTKECRSVEGASAINPRLLGDYNNVIAEVHCYRSGLVKVELSPQNGGKKLTLYDGIFVNGKKKSFPGVSGSYNAGILRLLQVGTEKPSGPMVPVNKCQASNTCEEEFNQY